MKKGNTNEERNAKVEALVAKLDAGVEALVTTEDWIAHLKALSVFHTYSWNNQFLIAIQRPGSTRVAGFNAWKKLGRWVRKGERGIAILAPVVVKKKETDDQGNEVEKTFVAGFRTVHVFDVSQTDGKELPKISRPKMVDGDDAAAANLFDAMVDFAEKDLNVPVRVASVAQGNGYLDLRAREIVVEKNLPAMMRAKTLAHELGHAILHLDSADVHAVPVMEVEAESTAFVAMGALGVDTDCYSFDYVAGWSNGDMETVKAAGARIQKAAHRIIEAVETRLAAKATAAA